MGYPIRDYSENITHHVTSRCIETRFLLQKAVVKKMFFKIIEKAQKKYKFELNYYTIMDNHFHLIIKILEGGDSLDKIMQYIKSNFARKYNKTTGRTGPFWNERYKTKIIEKAANPELYFIHTLFYLSYNPVKAKIVKNAFNYKYSSLLFYINKGFKTPIKVTFHHFFLKLGNNIKQSMQIFNQMFKNYCENYNKFNWDREFSFNFK